MGMYSVDTSSVGFDVPVMEGFEGTELELQDLMVESYQDQLAMFETGLMGDMRSAMGKVQGLDEEAIESIQEGVLADVWNRIKEFVKKVWAKIKSIFTAFIARFEAMFGKSDKAFVDKYKKEIFNKTYTDFKVTYREPKNPKVGFLHPAEVNAFITTLDNKNKAALEKDIDNFESDDAICKYLKGSVGNVNPSSAKEYEKEALDEFFDDEEEHENINMSNIMTKLLGMKEATKNAKKAQTDGDKEFSKILKAVEKHSSDIAKARAANGKGTADSDVKKITGVNSTNDDLEGSQKVKNQDLETYQLGARLAQMELQAISTAASKITAVNIKAVKMERAIYRKIWAKAVAYHKKSEDAYMDAVAESVLYEWETMDEEYITEAKGRKSRKKGLKAEADDLGGAKEECNN